MPMLSPHQVPHAVAHGQDDLFAAADVARRAHCGEAVHVRGIIEFSNVCDRDCLYCGLRRSHTALKRYTMGADEIVEVAAAAAHEGVGTIVLQSGESDNAPAQWLARVIEAIKSRCDVAVTLCVGCKPRSFYAACRRAGADRYLIKHETASGALYRKLHPDSALGERLGAIEDLRSLGYQTGTGCIVGLPGQTADDLARDIELTRSMDVDMAAFGPFVPHPGTPLADQPAGGLPPSLRVIAVARLVLGPVHIPATSALDAVHPDGRAEALCCGANVLMADLTPLRYRRLYDIYPSSRALNSLERVGHILRTVGRPVAEGPGHSLKLVEAPQPCTERQRALGSTSPSSAGATSANRRCSTP